MRLQSVVGVFETGLFLGLCDTLVIGTSDGVEQLEADVEGESRRRRLSRRRFHVELRGRGKRSSLDSPPQETGFTDTRLEAGWSGVAIGFRRVMVGRNIMRMARGR